MKKKLLPAVALLGLGVIGGAVAPAFAQGAPAGAAVSVPAANIIIARQAGMDVEAGLLNAIKAAMTSDGEVKQFKGSADALIKWSRAIPGLFVPGSDKGDTKALPAAFSDPAGFAKAANTMTVAETKLSAAAAANDKAAFAAAFQEVGQSCGACHRAYKTR